MIEKIFDFLSSSVVVNLLIAAEIKTQEQNTSPEPDISFSGYMQLTSESPIYGMNI